MVVVVGRIAVGADIEAVMEVPAIVRPVGVSVTAAVEAVVAAIAPVVTMQAAVAAVECGRGAETSTMEAAETATVETTAMEASTVEASESSATAVEAAAVETATMKTTAAAMTATAAMPKLDRHRVACGLRRGQRARAHRRQCFGALL